MMLILSKNIYIIIDNISLSQNEGFLKDDLEMLLVK